MQGSKEILDLLTKFKDTRLNLAIFLVSNILLFSLQQELFTLNAVSETVLQGLVFVTSIRLVYGIIGLIFDFFNNKQISKKQDAKKSLKLGEAKQEAIKNKEKMLSDFMLLDVFQLYIIQELKRQNHKSVIKGASLFTLKHMNIIYTPAVGEKSVSASLTKASSDLLNEKIWAEFDDLKYVALKRFCVGLQPEEIKCFIRFLEKDRIITKSGTGRNTTYSDSYYVFSKYSDTILFSQPQRGYDYTIDPIAKDVIISIYGDELEAVNGYKKINKDT
jgi:hypothetical protein